MSFTDKLKLIIDVDSNGAISGLSGLKTKMSEAEGFFGKLKAGAGGLKDMFTSLGPAGQAGIAAAGVTAVGAAAFKVVGDFADLGIEVGQFSDATGLSAEESSRWVEVADEMGISSGTLEAVLGKMNKAIEPEKWKALGVEIAHAKDGTVDVSATFLNAIEHLHGLANASDQAREGQLLFGRGWQQVSELVGSGADELRGKLAAVEDQKILTSGDVSDARDYRHTMDELGDSLQDVALTLGKNLLPLIKAGAEQFTTMIHAATGAAGAIKTFGEKVVDVTEITDWSKVMAEATASLKAMQVAGESAGAGASLGLEPLVTKLKEGQAATGEFEKRMSDTTAAADAQAARMAAAAAGIKGYNDQLAAQARVASDAAAADRDLAAALNEQIQGAENAADSQLALNDATQKFADAAAATVQAQKDKGAGSAEYKAAVDGERDALIDAAKAQQRLSDDQAQALNVTLTATEKVDGLNASLENQAAYATPAARRAAYEYLLQLNQIPAEKASEILALVDEGKLAEANAKLNDNSKTRNAAIWADAQNVEATRAQLHSLTNPLTVEIFPHYNFQQHARGGRVQAGEVALVGEDGPELVAFDQPGTVSTAGQTRSILAGGSSGGSSPVVGGGGNTVVFNVYTRDMTLRQFAELYSKAQRQGVLK